MKWSDIDWSVLRVAMVVLLLSTLFSGAMLTMTYMFRQDAEAQFERQRGRFIAMRTRYQTLDDEQRIREEYLPVYRDLESAGIIGEERRLNWIETLRSAVADVKLPSLSWEISSQGDYQSDVPVPTGVFTLHASEMRLDLGLLHEGDLQNLLNQLDRHAEGLYTVSGCILERAGPEFGTDPTKANLNARCTLRWLTLRPPAETGTGV